MPAVFVHGNPETAAIWRPLLAELGRDDVLCLSPPGFGAPLPAGFAVTVDGYLGWLVAELQRIGEPVDLVGHDWGGGHVLGVAMARPELIRSWVSDVPGLFDPEYTWHELARIWQTPGRGEEHVAAFLGGDPAERVRWLTGRGMPEAVAAEVAAGQDEAMGRGILGLYRSAAQPVMAERGEGLSRAARRPGLAVIALEDDKVGTRAQRLRAAEVAGARVELLPGLGHWWIAQDPVTAAEVLDRFWRDLPA
ncbi:pimeloyl-ACP methyl ester carboxylesterase [Amycolatopsis bartoniae]|uniref:Alpha/beta hydrolase n=1 Tax=Amycolatopsis bartoniae TaxID=941986 RepID=A0A8H9J0K7_9PSEU|nr:alpha/beta fold hydrolase [Amycolatopsis bartoniae]MBB2937439.1 pimeloyl-ACP methyl ester carboxylesterase [Amycolatopsis bartoniae]TVT00075.1 alpha/beta hydrolase [Amycolatopsis bartoniae]GHF86774.1 alpha/beta hydrolase [Amycolatopsis bartoniae]